MSGTTPSAARGPSRFFETRLATHLDESAWRRPWWFRPWVERFLQPLRVNKDYEPLWPSLDKWWIEFPDVDEHVWREIGFDQHGEVLVAAPSNRNWGFWNDTNMTLDDFERQDSTLAEVTAKHFEETWREYFESSSDSPRGQ